MKDPTLGLQVAESGLTNYPDQFDLLADRAKCLVSLGRVDEAQGVLSDLEKHKPAEFYRSWRPIVFYCQAIQAGGLTKDNVAKMLALFDVAVERQAHEIKIWGEYAIFLERLGRSSDAEAVYRKGVTHNPYSQQLNYSLGDMLLRGGRAKEAVALLEKALACDYQDSYQHDVAQDAVRTSLAEAYEASGELEKAAALYKLNLDLAKTGEIRAHVLEYSRNRLIALASVKALEGASPIDIEESIESRHVAEGSQGSNPTAE